MSIDMQFTLLSSDLDTAKSTQTKVRSTDGGCGDKGFGDVFDEKLQQVNETETAAVGNNSRQQKAEGQEVATLRSEQPEVAVATIAETPAAPLSVELSSELLSAELDADAPIFAEQSVTTTLDAKAEQASSLFQLIAKSRDYAAELEPSSKAGSADTDDTTTKALASVLSTDAQQAEDDADSAALLLQQLQQTTRSDAKRNTEQAKQPTDVADDLSAEAQTDAKLLAPQSAALQNVAEQNAAGQSADKRNDIQKGAAVVDESVHATTGQKPGATEDSDLTGAMEQSEQLVLQAKGSVDTEITKDDASSEDGLGGPGRAEKLSAEQKGSFNDQSEQLSQIKSATVTEQTAAEAAQTAKAAALTEVKTPGTTQSQIVAELTQSNSTGQDSAQLTEQVSAAALLAATPGTVQNKDKNKTSTQAFAEFQKSANAALAQQQKIAQQTEMQHGTESGKAAADATVVDTVAAALNLPHQDGTTPVLTASEKSLAATSAFSQGSSQSGSQSGSQQHNSFSQILATKQADQQIQTQPALSLLEPNAATQLKERVMYQVNQKIQSADIRLTPEDLGTVQIKINLQQEQLSVQFVVQQSAAKEALEQQMPRLKELLQEQGMALTDGQVHQQQGEQQQQQDERRTAGRAATRDTTLGDDEAVVQQVQVAVSDRMVDYYA